MRGWGTTCCVAGGLSPLNQWLFTNKSPHSRAPPLMTFQAQALALPSLCPRSPLGQALLSPEALGCPQEAPARVRGLIFTHQACSPVHPAQAPTPSQPPPSALPTVPSSCPPLGYLTDPSSSGPQACPGLHPGCGGRHSPSELPHGSGVGPSPAAGAWVPPQGSTGGPAEAAGLQGSPEAGVGAGPPHGSAAGGTGGPPQGSEVGAAVGMAVAMGAGPPQGSEAGGGAGAVKTSARSMRDDCREEKECEGEGWKRGQERACRARGRGWVQESWGGGSYALFLVPQSPQPGPHCTFTPPSTTPCPLGPLSK